MMIHDWSKVPAGIFHHFHNAWITQISDWLNAGALPLDYYAIGEQRVGDMGPDVLTLHNASDDARGVQTRSNDSSPIAVLNSPPKVEAIDELKSDRMFYAAKQRRIAIRHVSHDDLVAMIEIVSPSNKRSRREVELFIEKLVQAASAEIHLMILDLFPPSSTNPFGIHSEFAEALGNDPKKNLLSADRDRGLYAYDSGTMTAYLQPIGLSESLIDMPLFLRSGQYINIDLATTYERAYQYFPSRFKHVLEGSE